MGFARDPESRALRRRLLIRSALLLSRPPLPPPLSDTPHHQSSNDISRIVRLILNNICFFGLNLNSAFPKCSLTLLMQGGHVF